MSQPTSSACSIARPLLAELTRRPFAGRVLGAHRRACNLIDEAGRILTLALPEVGNGPFAILLDGAPGIFDDLEPRQPARSTGQALTVGQWVITLAGAVVWEPRLPQPVNPLNLELMIRQVQPYATWPNFDQTTPFDSNMARLARQAAGQLAQALTQPQHETALATAAARLAGLGRGLTPAGDDYLLGVMAALWLTGRPEPLATIAKVAGPHTNALSRAFLEAAAHGEFIEPWHALALAWGRQERGAVAQAVDRIAHFGASSGRDALAGFANTLLNRKGVFQMS
ncbi:MAG: DUF2877 domain-containing protein [Chloroflexota bacterium]